MCAYKQCLLISVILKFSHASFFGTKLPCQFYDSVNITNGVFYPDKHILYNGIEYPLNQYANVIYDLEKGREYIRVNTYIRGCLCNFRTCLRLCCPFGSFVDEMNANGIKCRESDTDMILEAEVIDQNNQTQIERLDKHFQFIERPCNRHLALDDFKIHKNGIISHKYGRIEHGEYCLKVTPNFGGPSLKAFTCDDQPKQLDIKYTILPYVMLTSIVFIIITIAIYMAIPELRNFHGKGILFCAVLILILSFWKDLSYWNYVHPFVCKLVGSMLYFAILSMSLGLNVMSLDLWFTLRTTVKTESFSERAYFLCMLYTWGIPFFLTIIGHLFDAIDSIPTQLKPGFGTETCFLKKDNKRDLSLSEKNESQESVNNSSSNNTKNNSRNFLLYFRLFFSMGLTGIVSSLRVLAPNNGFFYLVDILNATLGIVMFALFVLRRRVLCLIRKQILRISNHLKPTTI